MYSQCLALASNGDCVEIGRLDNLIVAGHLFNVFGNLGSSTQSKSQSAEDA